MNGPRNLLVATALLAALVPGQQDPAEFARLQPRIQVAVAKAAPFVVAIETFGGTRRQPGEDRGPVDGIAPDETKPPKPATPPAEPKPKPDPDPDADPKPEPAKPKPKVGPLSLPGFQQAQGRSTGVVLSADGWILCARFALQLDPTTILVTLADGRTMPARRAGEDTSRGLALLKVEAEGLPTATWVPPEQVRVGQWALALGRTFGTREPTCHWGIVSALGRQFGRALQVDAWVSPANYGGPVVDLEGRAYGVAVPLSPAGRDAGVEWYDSGIGFCATIAGIEPLLERMKQGEVLHRAWLGIGIEATHLGPGAQLRSVDPKSPAGTAGIAKGEVILAVDGVVVQNGYHVQVLLSSRMGGTPVTLRVRAAEGGTERDVALVLADVPVAERKEQADPGLPAGFPLPEGNEGR